MRDIPTKTDGVSTLPAAEFNEMAGEMETLITETGLSLTSGTTNQMSNALANHAAAAHYYTDGGTANAKVLTKGSTRRSTTSYITGLRVVFVNSTANTAAVTINVDGLGVKDLKRSDNQALSSGQLTAGQVYTAVYDGTSFRLEDPTLGSGFVDITANTTLDITHKGKLIRCDKTSGSFTVTLPTAASVGDGYRVGILALNGANSYQVTIARSGADTISGATSYLLYNTYELMYLRVVGGIWYVESWTHQAYAGQMYLDTTQSIANATFTAVDFTTYGLEGSGNGVGPMSGATTTNLWFNLTTNRFIPTQIGVYHLYANAQFAANATGVRTLTIYKNGTDKEITTRVTACGGGANDALSIAGIVEVTSLGDYFELYVRQTSGGNLDVSNCFLSAVLVSETLASVV